MFAKRQAENRANRLNVPRGIVKLLANRPRLIFSFFFLPPFLPFSCSFSFLFLLRCKQQKAFTTYTTGNFGTDRAKHKSEVVIGGKEKCLCNECLSLYLRYRCLLEWLFRVKFLRPLACRVKFSFFIRSSKNLEASDVEHDKSRLPFFATESINIARFGIKRSLKNMIRILVLSRRILILWKQII